VDRIVADRWRGTRCEQDVTQNPSLDDFMRAFDALDANERTMLCLYSSKSRHLTIGGGDGKYVVYASLPKDEFWNLLSDIAENRTIMVNAGGQEGDFPARKVVDEMRARRAGTAFMRDGELDQSLRWERQE
jgi:hypothetical protein